MKIFLALLAGSFAAATGCLFLIARFVLGWVVRTAVWSLIVYGSWLVALSFEVTTLEPTAVQVIGIGFLIAFVHTFLRTIFSSSSSSATRSD